MKKIYFLFLFVTFLANSQSWQQVGTTLTDLYMTTESKAMTFDTNGNLYLVGMNLPSFNASVKKFNGTSWSSLSMTDFGPTGTNLDSYKIAATNSNNIYVAYRGNTGVNTSYVGVQKFNGTSWVDLGTSELVTYGSLPELTLDNNGVPYIAFMRKNLSSTLWEVHVMKFDLGVWAEVGTSTTTNVGGDGFQGNAIRLEFDGNNVPYLCFAAPLYNYDAVVYKFNGTTWDYITGSRVYETASGKIAFSINKSNNHLFLGVKYDLNNVYPSFREYDGTNWTNIGIPNCQHDFGVSAYNVNTSSLFLAHKGLNSTYSDLTILTKYNAGNWYATNMDGLNIETNTNSYNVFRFSLTFDAANNPYVVYSTNGNLTGSGGRTKVYKYTGTYPVLNTILSNENFYSNKAKIYPNPTNGSFEINIAEEFINSNVTISNLLGQKIKSFKMNSQIVSENLNTGIYIISIEKEGKYFSEKIIVN